MDRFSSSKLFCHLEFKNGNLIPYPVTMELHPTNRCSFSCSYCSDSVRRIDNASLSDKVLIKVINDFTTLGGKSIVWEGGGEPTLHPNFIDMLYLSRKCGLRNGVTTNGSMLYKEELRNYICEYTDWCRVSVDSYDIKSHSKSKGVCVEVSRKVFDGMKKLADEGYKNLGYSFIIDVLTSRKELCMATEKAIEIGCKYIQFKPLLIDRNKYLKFDNSLIDYLSEKYCNEIQILSSRMDGGVDKGSFSVCKSHEYIVNVAATGDVWVCCAYAMLDGDSSCPYMKEDLVFGNVNKDYLFNIWKSENRKKITDRFNDPDVVRKCPECRFAEYNSLLEKIKNIDEENMFL